MSDNEEWSDLQSLRFYCRHLVALCISYHTSDQSHGAEPHFFACAGTIVCFNNRYCFLTAGHILEDLDKNLRSGAISVHTSVLADTFGSDATTDKPIPFDFSGAPKLYLYEDGLDFGLVALDYYYVRLLEENGIKAIRKENWEHQKTIHFDGYAMLGLPEEFMSSQVFIEGSEVVIRGTVTPTMITVNALEQPPDDLPKTKYPRFIGEIDPSIQIGSIKGMSGGPIFGFSLRPPIRYWVVAIQSSWLPTRRITFGCPLPVLGDLIEALIEA